MTPIISPWVFYLMPIVNKINFIAGAILVIGGVVALVAAIELFELGDPFPKWLKGVFIGLIFTLVVFVFTPSEKTITKMILAQNVTYERVEAVSDTVETVYNDIIELFDDKEDTDG
jgi:hypothetical protein